MPHRISGTIPALIANLNQFRTPFDCERGEPAAHLDAVDVCEHGGAASAAGGVGKVSFVPSEAQARVGGFVAVEGLAFAKEVAADNLRPVVFGAEEAWVFLTFVGGLGDGR